MLHIKSRFSRVRSFGSVNPDSRVVRTFGVLSDKPVQEEAIVHGVIRRRPITMSQSVGSTTDDL